MPRSTVAKLSVQIQAQTAAFQSGMFKASQSVAQLSGQVGGMAPQIQQMNAALKATGNLLGGAAVVGGTALLVRELGKVGRALDGIAFSSLNATKSTGELLDGLAHKIPFIGSTLKDIRDFASGARNTAYLLADKIDTSAIEARMGKTGGIAGFISDTFDDALLRFASISATDEFAREAVRLKSEILTMFGEALTAPGKAKARGSVRELFRLGDLDAEIKKIRAQFDSNGPIFETARQASKVFNMELTQRFSDLAKAAERALIESVLIKAKQAYGTFFDDLKRGFTGIADKANTIFQKVFRGFMIDEDSLVARVMSLMNRPTQLAPATPSLGAALNAQSRSLVGGNQDVGSLIRTARQQLEKERLSEMHLRRMVDHFLHGGSSREIFITSF